MLGYTVHAILDAVAPVCEAGALNGCVEPLLDIFIDDIFGETSEEKEVEAIANKLKEARSTKSFESFSILAKFITPPKFSALLEPVKTVMAASESAKVARKLEEIFRNVALGLNVNPSIVLEEMLKVAYSLIAENLPLSKQGQIKVKDKHKRPQSIFILGTQVKGES